MLVSNNTSGESADEEISYDSEKDPEYTPRIKEKNCKLKKNLPIV